MFELIKNNQELESIDTLFNQLLDDTFFINKPSLDTVNSCFSDNENEYRVEFSLPGLDKKDVNLNFNDQYLYLNYEANQKTSNSFLNRSFNRRIKLPNNIDIEKIVAELKNGILSISIPKNKKESQNKKITIK